MNNYSRLLKTVIVANGCQMQSAIRLKSYCVQVFYSGGLQAKSANVHFCYRLPNQNKGLFNLRRRSDAAGTHRTQPNASWLYPPHTQSYSSFLHYYMLTYLHIWNVWPRFIYLFTYLKIEQLLCNRMLHANEDIGHSCLPRSSWLGARVNGNCLLKFP